MWTAAESQEMFTRDEGKKGHLSDDLFYSSQRDIQRHHQREAKGEKNSADVGGVALRHLGNQLLDDDIEHGTRGKA